MDNGNITMQGKILLLGCTDTRGDFDGRLFAIFIPYPAYLNPLGLNTNTKYFFPIYHNSEDWVCGYYELEFHYLNPQVSSFFQYERKMHLAIQIFPTGIKFLSESE
jgi:hypothetical protein